MPCNCGRPLEERVQESKDKLLKVETMKSFNTSEIDYINNPCPCTEPGFCPHYQIELIGRLWELSRMTNDLGKQYRQLWIYNMLNPNPSKNK